MEEKIVKLTGEPVSEEMRSILERLSQGQGVSSDEIEATKEMKMARSNVSPELDTSMLKNREELQHNIFRNLWGKGAAVIDEAGKTQYNGDVALGKRLDIVIGLPASGKSSAIVDNLSEEFHSRVIDNDEAKKMIPQFNDGWGAGAVHKESQDISDKIFLRSVFDGENIVLPKVGADAEKLINRYVDIAKENDYSVNVHFVDLDRNKALGRMLNRFIEEGRFLDPSLIEKYAPLNRENRIEQAYGSLKNNSLIDGFSKWDNDVARGERPILLEHENLTGKFIDEARTEREDVEHGEREDYSAIDTGDRGRSGQGISERDGLRQGAYGRTEEHDMGGTMERSRQSEKRLTEQEFSDTYTQLLTDAYGEDGRHMAQEDLRENDSEHMIKRIDEALSAIGNEDSAYVTSELMESADLLKEHIREESDLQREFDLPDDSFSTTDMHDFGYTWDEMLPLSQEKALELFDKDIPVNRLFSDGTEAVVESRNDITEHDGMFGVERADWIRELDRAEQATQITTVADLTEHLANFFEKHPEIATLPQSHNSEIDTFMDAMRSDGVLDKDKVESLMNDVVGDAMSQTIEISMSLNDPDVALSMEEYKNLHTSLESLNRTGLEPTLHSLEEISEYKPEYASELSECVAMIEHRVDDNRANLAMLDIILEKQEKEVSQIETVEEDKAFHQSKLQTFDEFLEENYEMTSEEFERVGTYERRTIEDEYKEMVNAITGKDPWEVAKESEDHTVSFDDYVSSVSMDEPQTESDRDIDEEILDAFNSEVDMKSLVNNFYKEYQAAGGELSNEDVRDCLITNNLEKLSYLSEENRDLFHDAKDAADQIENMAYDGDLSLKEQTQAILASLDKDKFPESIETRLNQVLDIYGAKDVADEIYLKTPFGITQLSQVEVAPNIDDGFAYKDLDTGISYAFHADDIDGVAADKGEFFTSDLDRLDSGDQALLMTYGNEKQGYDVAVWNEPDGSFSQFVVADAGKLQTFMGEEYNKDGMVLAMGDVPQSMYDKSILEVSNILAESVIGESLEGYQASRYTDDFSKIFLPEDTPVILPVQAEFDSFDVHFANYQIAESFAESYIENVPDVDVDISTRSMTEESMDKLMENTKDIYAYGTPDHGYISFVFDKDNQQVTATKYDSELTPVAQEKVSYPDRKDFAEEVAAPFYATMFISNELTNPAFDDINELHWINTEQFVADVEKHEDSVRNAVEKFDSMQIPEKYEAIFKDEQGKIVSKERFDNVDSLSMESAPENGTFEVRESGKTIVKGDIDDNMHDIIAEATEQDVDTASYDKERAALGLDHPATNEEIAHDVAEILYAHSDKDISLDEIQSDILFKIEDAKDHPENLDALIDRLDKIYENDRPTLQESAKIYACEERLDSIKETQARDERSVKPESKDQQETEQTQMADQQKGSPQQDDLVTKQQNPLNKVEELEEGNYNQIDGIINNLPPKKSLKDVVEEKKEAVNERSQEKHDEKEHTTHKSADRDSI